MKNLFYDQGNGNTKVARSHDGAENAIQMSWSQLHAGVQLGFPCALLLMSCLENSLKYLYFHTYFVYCSRRDNW